MYDDLRHEKSCNSLIEIKIPTAKSVLKKTVIRKIKKLCVFILTAAVQKTGGEPALQRVSNRLELKKIQINTICPDFRVHFSEARTRGILAVEFGSRRHAIFLVPASGLSQSASVKTFLA